MISQESDELKMLYIEKELSQHSKWLCDMLAAELDKKKLRKTDTLIDSLNYSSFKDGNNPGLKVEFMSYGRAVDIQSYKEKKHSVNINRDIWGIKENRAKLKKNNWYARNMFGGLNRLISRIMYGLSDEEIARLKGILEQRKSSII